MTDNNVPVDGVEALMFPGNRPASSVAAAPLTAGQGVSAATLAATGNDTAAPTHAGGDGVTIRD